MCHRWTRVRGPLGFDLVFGREEVCISQESMEVWWSGVQLHIFVCIYDASSNRLVYTAFKRPPSVAMCNSHPVRSASCPGLSASVAATNVLKSGAKSKLIRRGLRGTTGSHTLQTGDRSQKPRRRPYRLGRYNAIQHGDTTGYDRLPTFVHPLAEPWAWPLARRR